MTFILSLSWSLIRIYQSTLLIDDQLGAYHCIRYYESKRESKFPMHGYKEWIKARSLFDSFC